MLELLEVLVVAIWLAALVMWITFPAKERKGRVFKTIQYTGITCLIGWLVAVGVVDKKAYTSYRLSEVETSHIYEEKFIQTTVKSECTEFTYMARPKMFVISTLSKDILVPVEKNVVSPKLCKERM